MLHSEDQNSSPIKKQTHYNINAWLKYAAFAWGHVLAIYPDTDVSKRSVTHQFVWPSPH